MVSSKTPSTTTFHAMMFPWFAMGHITPFLHLSNKLAEKGNKISFICPTKTISTLQPLNLYPNLIAFVPITVTHIHGLPPGSETMSDVPLPLAELLFNAFHSLKNQIKSIILDLTPDFVFFDFAYWIPSITKPLGIKSIYHSVISATSIAYFLVPSRKIEKDDTETKLQLMNPPFDFPQNSSLKLHPYELPTSLSFWTRKNENTNNLSTYELLITSLQDCDLISVRTCREIEGSYCDYLEIQYKKPFLLTGPTLPNQQIITNNQLEEKWVNWLGGFKKDSVLYCAFGSEWVLTKHQFQELLLGFELTGLPFFVALKPPTGTETVEEALPEGFEDRVKGRGVVHGGWVHQLQLLAHPSVGCFISHCGFGSMWEALMSDSQIVLIPHLEDQCLNARILSGDLKVAVEVERREEDGWFSKQDVCKAVKIVMDEGNKIGYEVRDNHSKLKVMLLKKEFESSYMENFINKLQSLNQRI